MDKQSAWIQTVTGKRFYPFAPSPNDICLIDIATSLAHTCRFRGHTKQFYSVAQHSLLMARCVPKELKPWALLHDAAEAYLADIVRPIKVLFPDYHKAEENILKCIAERYELEWPMPPEIKEADDRLLLAEKNQLFRKTDNWPSLEGIKPMLVSIVPSSPDVAYTSYLHYCLHYLPRG